MANKFNQNEYLLLLSIHSLSIQQKLKNAGVEKDVKTDFSLDLFFGFLRIL